MNINWFTVIAQVINFLILVWLLKRFLYKPILKAVDEREKKIAGQLKDAEDKKAIAQKEQDDFKNKNDAFDQQKKGLMDKAVAEIATERQKLLDEARSEANKLSANLEAAAKESQENLNREIVQKAQKEVFAITRKTLTDLASLSLEEQTVNIFIKRLNELKEDEKKKFIETFKSGSEPVLIRSAFELPDKQQTDIKKSVSEILRAETPFQFKTAPELISGIELTAKGYKLAWSISEYLNSLEKTIAETLKEKEQPEQEKKVEPDKKPEPEKI
ncbi:MAG: F0F1 ATP synthase subunit B family protein [Chitinophagaceae bacterium]